MNENKLAFATFITLAAVVAGTYLSGYLALALLQLDTGQLKWNTYLGYSQALDLPELAPYANRIKWSGRIGFGLPAAAWLMVSFLIIMPKPKSAHGHARSGSRGELARKGLLRASAGGTATKQTDQCHEGTKRMKKVATACLIAVTACAHAHAFEKTPDRGHHCQAFQSGVTFDFDKTVLKPYTIRAFKEKVEILKQYPDLRIEVAGHTDSIGSNGYNQALSYRRALVAYEYLVHHGVDPAMLTTAGYGEDRPIAPNTEEDGSDYPCGRLRNRRVELNVLN